MLFTNVTMGNVVANELFISTPVSGYVQWVVRVTSYAEADWDSLIPQWFFDHLHCEGVTPHHMYGYRYRLAIKYAGKTASVGFNHDKLLGVGGMDADAVLDYVYQHLYWYVDSTPQVGPTQQVYQVEHKVGDTTYAVTRQGALLPLSCINQLPKLVRDSILKGDDRLKLEARMKLLQSSAVIPLDTYVVDVQHHEF